MGREEEEEGGRESDTMSLRPSVEEAGEEGEEEDT